jgi:hypothetical protein
MSKRVPKLADLKGPFKPTTLPGGVAKIIEICEHLRERNSDGYLKGSQGGGILANVKDHRTLRVSKGTTCTPFTATIIALAFDPDYPREDLPFPGGDPYVPLFNGGRDPLMPYADFHVEHNKNGQAIASIVKYNLGKEIKPKQMRRGDLVEIGWYKGLGHGVFCWDVHLNDKGEVDCFQYLGANGGKGLKGVTIAGCIGERWLRGTSANGVAGKGSLEKAKDKIFLDEDEIVQAGRWLALPGIAKGAIKLDTFRVRPKSIIYSDKHINGGWSAKSVRCGRFHYEGEPPKPYCMKDGNLAPSGLPGHASAPVTVVKGKSIQTNPDALKKVPTKTAPQDGERPTDWQHWVEQAMQDFFAAKWIEADPGAPSDINNDSTQAAIRDFQGRFKLKVDGIAGPKTREAIRKQLPACRRQHVFEQQLARLFRGNKLLSDPGEPNGRNDPDTAAAVMEFQRLYGLQATGIPDADTQAKLQEVVDAHEPSVTQHGLELALHNLYWVGNTVAAGGTRSLRLHSSDIMVSQECPIYLKEEGASTEMEAAVRMNVSSEKTEASVPIPSSFGQGARVHARVTIVAGGGDLEMSTSAPLIVEGQAATAATMNPVPPSDEKRYRKWRITTYYRAEQGPASDAETVPVYDHKKNVLARVSPGFFSKIALEGDAKLRDGRFLKVSGDRVPVDYSEYAGVWEYHQKHMSKRPPGHSGLVIKAHRVVEALAFKEVPARELGKGFGIQRGIPYEPFRTLAADLGLKAKSENRFKGKGGVVPAKTKVFIKEYVGLKCPDGKGGTFVHDGWFIVNDTGGGIFGAHFDVFVGTKELGKQVKHASHMYIWFEGIEDRVPEDYDYGLYDT